MKRLIPTLAMLVLQGTTHAATIYLPKIADGNGYFTTITAENPNPTMSALSAERERGRNKILTTEVRRTRRCIERACRSPYY
jgi:hypothetical protein